MKILKLAFLCMVLSACTTVQQTTRVSTGLHAKEFNSIASKYMDRPTFAAIEKMSDGETVLAISMNKYGSSFNIIRLSQNNVSDYLGLIDKYSEWEALARSRGDAFTKEIGQAKTWGNALSGGLKFTFHSGNSGAHFLSISFCGAGTCLDDQAIYFNVNDAKELAALLVKFKSGTIQQKNINAIYN